MSGLRVLIVDDEPPARARLAGLLAEIGGTELAGEAGNGFDAVDLAARLKPDIVLLDIRMPGMDGIEAARAMSELAEPPAVIFATAYDAYALQAFESQAIAYLLKPVRRDKLAAAITKAGRLTRPQLQRVAEAVQSSAGRTRVIARRREGARTIEVAEVYAFLAEQKYTRVRHAGGEDLIEESLRTLEEELGSAFVRIHRSALVNLRHIESVERDASGQYLVRLRGVEEALPVSRRMAGDLRERLGSG